MATLEQIAAALRKADAAGNVEDAKRLAQAYAQARDAKKPQSAPPAEPAPQPADWKRQVFGLGARNVATGITDVLGIVGNPVNYAASKVTGQPYQSMSDAMGGLLDNAGVPRPNTRGERISSDVGRAITGGGLTMGGGSLLPVASRANQFLTASPGLQTISAATGSGAASLTRESGGGPWAQTFAGLAGGFTPGGAGFAAPAGLRALARGFEKGRETVARNLEAFNRAGTSPSLGQATEGRFNRGLESLLAVAPGGAGRMGRFAEDQAEQIGARVDGIAKSLSPRASAEQAGRSIESGVDTFLDNFRLTSGKLYANAEIHVPPALPVTTTNAQAYLTSAARKVPGAENVSELLSNPKLASIRDAMETDLAANNGKLPFEAIKALRSKVGEMIGDAGIMSDIPTKQLRKFYGALSADMEAAIKATGNPKAVQAFSRANAHFKAGMDRMDVLAHVIERNGGPERVFAAAMSGTKEGATTLRAVTQSLPKDGQKQLAAAVVRRMGRASAGKQDDVGDVFSTETFLSNWNTMAPEAKGALFSRLGPQFNSDMDAIARAAANVRAGSRVFANPSGTAGKAAQVSAGTSFVVLLGTGNIQAAMAVPAGAALANGGARLMTSPAFVQWLARQTKLPASALPAQISVLANTAKFNNDPDALEFAEGLQAAED